MAFSLLPDRVAWCMEKGTHEDMRGKGFQAFWGVYDGSRMKLGSSLRCRVVGGVYARAEFISSMQECSL